MRAHIPLVVKVLEYLSAGGPQSLAELVESTGESDRRVSRVLDRLVARGIISERGGTYHFVSSPSNDRLHAELKQLYQKVAEAPARELLIRGYICQIPRQNLFHKVTFLEALEREGLDRHEVASFLQGEIERDYVREVNVVFTNPESPRVLPICFTEYHFERLRRLGLVQPANGHDHGAGGPSAGESEKYLVARYPVELAGPAEEFMREERRDITRSLQRLGVGGWRGWWWRKR